MTGLILNEAAFSHDSVFPKYPDERYTSPLLFAPHFPLPCLSPPSLCHFLYAPTLFSLIRPSAMSPPAQSCLLSYLNLTLRFISPPHASALPHPSLNPLPFSSHPSVCPFIISRPSSFPSSTFPLPQPLTGIKELASLCSCLVQWVCWERDSSGKTGVHTDLPVKQFFLHPFWNFNQRGMFLKYTA